MFKTIAIVFFVLVAIEATNIRYPEPRFEVERIPNGFFVFAHNDNRHKPAMGAFSLKEHLPKNVALASNYEVEDMDTGYELGTFSTADGSFDVRVPVTGLKIFRLTAA